MSTTGNALALAEDEAVTLVSELIRIDTTNTGDPATVVGERKAAEWVAEKLSEVGYETTYVESGAKGRGNVIARLAGSDPGRGARRGDGGTGPLDPVGGGRGERGCRSRELLGRSA